MNLRGPFALLRDSISFYKSHFRSLVAIMAAPAILFAVASYVMDIYTAPDGSLVLDGMSLGIIITLGVLLVISLVLGILSAIAVTLFIADPSRYPTTASAYREAKKYLGSYVLVGLLVGLAMLGGFILLVIPGIIFMVWFSFSQFVVLFEEKRGADALRASKALVRGRWWAVLVRQITTAIAYVAVSMLVSFVLGMVIPNESLAIGIADLIDSFLAIILAISLYFLYKDLKAGAPATVS